MSLLEIWVNEISNSHLVRVKPACEGQKSRVGPRDAVERKWHGPGGPGGPGDHAGHAQLVGRM